MDLLRVRMGYNRAVRAPNVAELFSTSPSVCGVVLILAPVTATPVHTAAQCATQGVTAAQYGSIVPKARWPVQRHVRW